MLFPGGHILGRVEFNHYGLCVLHRVARGSKMVRTRQRLCRRQQRFDHRGRIIENQGAFGGGDEMATGVRHGKTRPARQSVGGGTVLALPGLFVDGAVIPSAAP
jgi:hypothetical protein